VIYLWLYDGEVLGVGRDASSAEQRGLAVLAGYARAFRTLNPEYPEPSEEDVTKRLEFVKQHGQIVQYKLNAKNVAAQQAAQCDALVIRAIGGLLPTPDEMQRSDEDEDAVASVASAASATPAALETVDASTGALNGAPEVAATKQHEAVS